MHLYVLQTHILLRGVCPMGEQDVAIVKQATDLHVGLLFCVK